MPTLPASRLEGALDRDAVLLLQLLNLRLRQVLQRSKTAGPGFMRVAVRSTQLPSCRGLFAGEANEQLHVPVRIPSKHATSLAPSQGVDAIREWSPCVFVPRLHSGDLTRKTPAPRLLGNRIWLFRHVRLARRVFSNRSKFGKRKDRLSPEPRRSIGSVSTARIQALVLIVHVTHLNSVRGRGTSTMQGISRPSALRTTPHLRQTCAVTATGVLVGPLVVATSSIQSCSSFGSSGYIQLLLNDPSRTVKRSWFSEAETTRTSSGPSP